MQIGKLFRTTELFVPVLVIAGIFSSTPTCTGQQRKSDLDSILSGFPGYHLQTVKELDVDSSAFFLQHHPKANPSVVHADFDGDGNLDYALILRNDKSEAAKLVVLLCSSDVHCRVVSELDISGYSDSAFLRPVAKGSRVSQTKSSETDGAPVILEFSGVRVTYFEKAELVLYWNGKLKKIESIATAD